ncbi:MAG: ABC transporter ATP-binding protein, partial [Clostridia bacterium]|nr:ABC transporter ATP-binding protein [Clostridia bacterium]
VVFVTPLSLLVAKFIATHTHDYFVKQSEIRAEQTAFAEEIIGGLKTVQAFSMEAENERRFNEIDERLQKASLDATFYSSMVNPSTRFVNNFVYAVVALIGALSIVGGGFTAGGLTKFLSYANQYTKPFNEISGVVTELSHAFVCASRIFDLLDEEELSKEPTTELKQANGNVDFDKVYFSYTPEKPLIENFSLKVKVGQKIAIVGPTGCGKTTLVNLLMRFYDPVQGQISVDGVKTQTVTRNSLRKNYGMVLQDTWIQHGTVKQNIAFGKPDATDEEIISAAKAAHAHGFIKRLKQGYETLLSEDGALSQGQKQLLCIARIMLLLPPILILDEATSSIDTRTEMKISDGFETLTKGKTSFVVAHRLSTIQSADIILVMNAGNVVEQGTHKELLEKKGFYYGLYQSQFA